MGTIGRLGALALGAIVLLPGANALTIGSNAAYTVEALDPSTGGNVTHTDQDGPYTANSGGVSSYVEYGDVGDIAVSNPAPQENEEVLFDSFGQAFAFSTESGDLFADAYLVSEDDVTEMAFHAVSSWSNVYENTTGGELTYGFDFFFGGGYLALEGNGGMAKFALDVQLNGSSIWSREASLTGSPVDDNVVLNDGGLVHDVFEEMGYIDVFFNPFAGNLDLGAFASGESFEITYLLEVWATTDAQFSYVDVLVGDPFGVGFQGSVTNPVPEPSTLALLGIGVLGIVLRRRRPRA